MENDCGIINSRFWLILLVFYMVRPNVFGACRIMVLSKSTAVAHFDVRGNARTQGSWSKIFGSTLSYRTANFIFCQMILYKITK